jgi:hypothetical protein
MIQLVCVYNSQCPLPPWINDPVWINSIKSKILQLHNQKYSNKPIQIHDIKIVPIEIPLHTTQLPDYGVQLSSLPSVFMYQNGDSNTSVLGDCSKKGIDFLVDEYFT